MEATTPTHYKVVFTPQTAGIVWYHFIITAVDGSQKRYGALDGKRGGKGQLYDWEPPSFQLTVLDADQSPLLEEMESNAIGGSFKDLFIGLFLGEVTAPAFVEAFETLRENSAPETFMESVDLVGSDDCVSIFARLGGVDADAIELESGDFDLSDIMEGWQMGQAKGRLWCASLIQLLSVGMPSEGDDAQSAYEDAIARWAEVDPD